MHDDSNPSPDLSSSAKPANLPSQFFLVRCERFRCRAYKDADGTWHNANDGSVLPDVLEVLEDLSKR
jgi:hypothetical protein